MPTRTASIIPQHRGIYRTSPVMRIYPITHIAVKRRIRPINRTLYVPVFNRIEMNVIDMTGKIIFVADLMLPKSTLPNSRLLAQYFRLAQCGIVLNQMPALFAYCTLDDRPTSGKIRIPLRQSPDAMEMFRQQHPGHYCKRQAGTRRFDTVAQGIAEGFMGKKLATPKSIHRKEIRSARHIGATIFGHQSPLQNP